jgi:hypothetical protein
MASRALFSRVDRGACLRRVPGRCATCGSIRLKSAIGSARGSDACGVSRRPAPGIQSTAQRWSISAPAPPRRCIHRRRSYSRHSCRTARRYRLRRRQRYRCSRHPHRCSSPGRSPHKRTRIRSPPHRRGRRFLPGNPRSRRRRRRTLNLRPPPHSWCRTRRSEPGCCRDSRNLAHRWSAEEHSQRRTTPDCTPHSPRTRPRTSRSCRSRKAGPHRVGHSGPAAENKPRAPRR